MADTRSRIFIPTRNSDGKASTRRFQHGEVISIFSSPLDIVSILHRRKRREREREREFEKFPDSIFSRINLILSLFSTRLLRASPIQFSLRVRLPVYGYP